MRDKTLMELEILDLKKELSKVKEDNRMLTKINCGIFDISDRLELVNADLERENEFLRDNAGNSNAI